MHHNRYNPFNLIHKGLRHLMYDTALKIQTADFATINGAASVITQLEQLLSYFEEHAHHEDTFVLPPVEKYNPELVADFESQHEEDHRLGHEIRLALASWKIAEGTVARLSAGKKIFFLFNEFIAFNLYHMNKEEQLINEVLWRHYTDIEIQGITQQIVQSIKPQILFEESRWMMKSINVREAVDWLVGVKVSAPTEVFAIYVKMAQEEMPVDRWLKVKETLFDERLITENLN
ncbi:MAG TPA: hemerythrin domain-containing protein [Cyclobacteriaceae bacterium]|nr:hemerythrin domain-containing protein [Cyclobacteriaceae bacterium]